MPLQIQTRYRGYISSCSLKIGIFHVVYNGPDEGIIRSEFSTIEFASGVNMKTGKPIKLSWEKSGGCILMGPIKEGKSGIIRVLVVGI